MKEAEVADVWRRLRAQKSRRLMMLEMHWRGIPKLTDNGIVFTHPFSLICGENGVGKSTILHRIFYSLARVDRRLEASVYAREEEGTLDLLRVEFGHGPGVTPQTMFEIDSAHGYFSPDGEALRIVLFDPAMHVPALLHAIRNDANFSEVIEPLLPKEYSVSETAEVAYLVGRDYERVLVFEIEGVAELGVFPYFAVTVAGVDYGSESMGFGELSLLLAYWLISRMPKGSLVLLEEPETFVSPRSQRRLTDIAARFALTNDLKIVATTHSPAIASRFFEDEITLVSRVGHTVTLHTPAPRVALERRLELVSPFRQVWFVEDALAARFIRFFINEMGIGRDTDVFIAGNNDAVITLATTARAFEQPHVSFVGLLDGDQRTRSPVPPANVGFLVSDGSPDSFILRCIRAAPRAEMAGVLGVGVAALELALGSCAGQEPHQALHTIRQELGLSLDLLVTAGLRWWAATNTNEASVFIDYLQGLAESARVGGQ